MTDLEKNIRALFSFNTKSIEEKEEKLNANVEEINKRDRTLVEKIGFIGKVDYSNLTPIERSKKENIETITLNDGSVKTIDEMFNKLLKPSQINYIVDPNERNETKILKIGELNVQFDLAKNGLNTIIDGSTKYIGMWLLGALTRESAEDEAGGVKFQFSSKSGNGMWGKEMTLLISK